MENEINLQILFWIGTGLMCVTIVTIFLIVLNYHRIVSIQKKEEAERLVQVVLDTEQKERQRVAMDLHDDVLGELNASLIYLRGVQESSQNSMISEHLSTTTEQLMNSINSIQAISYNLMPPELISLGVLYAVEQYLERISKSYAIKIDFYSNIQEVLISKKDQYEVFRIVQEITNNIIKHGEVTWIHYHIQNCSNNTCMVIEDDGIPYNFLGALKISTGLGLRNIVSRTKYLGGEVEHLSLSTGNKIELRIPHKTL